MTTAFSMHSVPLKYRLMVPVLKLMVLVLKLMVLVLKLMVLVLKLMVPVVKLMVPSSGEPLGPREPWKTW